MKDTVALSTKANTSGLVVTQAEVDGPNDWAGIVQSLPDPPEINDNSTGYVLPTLNHDLKGIAGGLGWGNPSKDIPAMVSDLLAGDTRQQGLRGFMPSAMAHLTTETRLTLLGNTKPAKDSKSPQNLVQYFYRCGSETEQSVSDLVKRYFKKEIRLDFSDLQHMRMRYATDFADVPVDPRDALLPMGQRDLLSEQGDGVRSFAGLVAAIEALSRPIYIIDEPEAFLHPPQAFHIGRLIGRRSSSQKQFIIATHSSDILRGILSATQDVSVVRVNRDGDTNSFCPIETATLQAVTTNPLLSSARVLEGLFYSSAVVVESDSDARFFASAFTQVNNELDTHFVAADNKQTVAKILALYCDMGVKHLGIVDFDMLRVGAELNDAMGTLGTNADSIQSVNDSQGKIAAEASKVTAAERIEHYKEVLGRINRKIDAYNTGDKSDSDDVLRFLQKRANEAANVTKPWKELKELGRAGLSDQVAPEFDNLYAKLMDDRLCIYPFGELESSLVEFGLKYTTNKKEWIVDALRLVSSLTVDDTKQFWRVVKQLVATIM